MSNRLFSKYDDKKIGAISMVALIVLLISAYLLFGGEKTNQEDSSEQVTPTVTCSDELLQRASPALIPEKYAELVMIADEVKKTEDYQRDVNCLYIITESYLVTGNAADAQQELDRLSALYSEDNGYSDLLGEDRTPRDLVSLQANIDFIDENDNRNIEYGVDYPLPEGIEEGIPTETDQ